MDYLFIYLFIHLFIYLGGGGGGVDSTSNAVLQVFKFPMWIWCTGFRTDSLGDASCHSEKGKLMKSCDNF